VDEVKSLGEPGREGGGNLLVCAQLARFCSYRNAEFGLTARIGEKHDQRDKGVETEHHKGELGKGRTVSQSNVTLCCSVRDHHRGPVSTLQDSTTTDMASQYTV